MNEHIGRLSAIGLWFEDPSAKGTTVNAQVRIPKMSWSLKPEFEEAVDDSSYGVIDEVFDSETTKNFSKLTMEGILRDDMAWYLFGPALGNYEKVLAFSATATGTPARGDVVYQWASFWGATWTWYVRKIQIVDGPTTLYRVSTTTGTFASGTDVATEPTGATYSSVDSATYSGAKGHFFSRQNDNNHPTVTIYDNDPIDTSKAGYGMINSLEISAEVGDYMKFNTEMRAKKMESATAQNPVYTTQTEFISRDLKVYFADTEADLNGATGNCLQNFKVNFNKNLKEVQCFGTDDIDAIHNQQFTIDGDMEAQYRSTTLRDYVVDSTKKAFRMEAINTTTTPIVTGVYPSIIIDWMKAWFNEWDKSDDNNDLVTQTLWYTGQYSAEDGATVEVLLITDTDTEYKYV